MNPKKTSKKQDFLAKHSSRNQRVESYQLSVDDVKDLKAYYEDKYKIRIIINGESEFGEALLKAQEQTNVIAFKQQSKYPLAVSVQKFFSDNYDGTYLINKYSQFYNSFDKIKEKIDPKYIDTDGRIKKELTLEELEALESKLSELDDKIKTQIKENFKKYIVHYSRYDGIDADSARVEIKQIQKTLKDNETVGYYYTNGQLSGYAHFEVILITKENIIKPVNWNVWDVFESNHFASPKKLYGQLETTPQADVYACGTLGMVYLKELLKNDAKQLKEYSLTFKYINDEGKETQFFLPSPHVLRYSQSSTYNKLINPSSEFFKFQKIIEKRCWRN